MSVNPPRPKFTAALASVACLLLGSFAGPADAMSFAEAWDAARQYDAQYRVAGHELASAQQLVPIARAALLPQVALNVASSEVVGSREFPNSLNQQVRTRLEYSAPQSSLTMRLPIFNREAHSRLGQAQAQTEVAESVYRIRGLDLIDRLASTYMQVLLTEEARQLAQAQVTAQTAQLAQLQQRFQRGEGTKVETAQSQATLNLLRVRVTEADDQRELALRQLRRITGPASTPTPGLSQLPPDYRPQPLVPEGLVQWLALAVRQSPSLQAREQSLLVARMNVQRNRAGHYPRLDLVASASRSQNESTSSLNQTTQLRSLGLQLNVPLFSGGGVEASVKQALADQARVEEEIRIERESLEVEVQRHYLTVTTGQSRMDAYRNLAEAAELSLQGTGRALEAGLATGNDVADALARVFAARRDLAQSRIEFLLARTRLMIQVGTPMAEVAADVDRALVATPNLPASAPAPRP